MSLVRARQLCSKEVTQSHHYFSWRLIMIDFVKILSFKQGERLMMFRISNWFVSYYYSSFKKSRYSRFVRWFLFEWAGPLSLKWLLEKWWLINGIINQSRDGHPWNRMKHESNTEMKCTPHHYGLRWFQPTKKPTLLWFTWSSLVWRYVRDEWDDFPSVSRVHCLISL